MSDEPTAKAAEGTPASQTPGAEATPASNGKIEFTTEQQAKIEEIKAQLRKEITSGKDYKTLKERAKLAEKLETAQTEREEADKSELQKLQDQVDKLTPVSESYKTLIESITAQVETMEEKVTPEAKGFYDAVAAGKSPEQKLALLQEHPDKFFGETPKAGTPPGGSPQGGKPDPFMEDAMKMRESMYGLTHPFRQDEKVWQKKLDDILSDMKKRKRE